ncbi:MAG: SIMPL domain-containing protein [Gemmatimonadaceae bacterium]
MTNLRITILGLTLALCAQPALSQANPNAPRPPEIMAGGRSEVSVTPDRATVLISVETRAPSAAAAASTNSAKMAAVLQALRAAGLSQADITTSGYTVGQDPRGMRTAPNLPQPPVEFLARNTVRATVRRVDDVGKVIDAALAGGATSVASVQMAAPNTDEARRTALAQAVAQAQRDAETLARAAGGSLGRLLSMSSSPSSPIMGGYGDAAMFEREFAMSAYPTMINPREVMVSVQAFGRWEFIPGASR